MNIKRLSAWALCFGLLGCARHGSAPTAAAVETATAPAPEPARAAPTPVAASPANTGSDVRAASIYDLSVPLRDDSGAVRSLDSFRGHPVLITMFYGTCPVACPLLTSDLKRIEQKIPESLRKDVRIVMVSFDPDRDSPELLARIKHERGLDAARWTLASTGDDEARELAGVLNIKYRKLDSGAFYHSSVIVLLDAQGRPRARVEGSGQDSTAMLSALTTASL
jgi:protein SCO1/2